MYHVIKGRAISRLASCQINEKSEREWYNLLKVYNKVKDEGLPKSKTKSNNNNQWKVFLYD
jgi:CRISPR/Cas system CMR-associated protein Cmr1 (group 7 of RAMP superfamily)